VSLDQQRRHTRSFKSKWPGKRIVGEEGRGRTAGRVASPGTEKSGSGQTVLRVVRRIVSDPDSRELSQTAFSSETTVVSPSFVLSSASNGPGG